LRGHGQLLSSIIRGAGL